MPPLCGGYGFCGMKSKFMLTPLNRCLLLLFLAVTSFIPYAVMSVSGVIDPFMHGEIASTIMLTKAGHLSLQASTIEYTPAIGVFLASLTFASGLSLTFLEYAPIAGVFGAFVVFILSRRLLKGAVAAMLVVNVLSYRF